MLDESEFLSIDARDRARYPCPYDAVALGDQAVPLEIARVIVVRFDLCALAGVVFAVLFLPRGVSRLDPRVAGARKTLRLLILPGVTALWPVFACRRLASSPAPVERNPHRTKAGRR